jgi:hypothetical protein
MKPLILSSTTSFGNKPFLIEDPNAQTLETLAEYGFNFEDRIIDRWDIVNSRINATVIGEQAPAKGTFTDLVVTNSTLFDGVNSDVTWNAATGVLKNTGCTELGNIEICNNTIRSLEQGSGDIIVSSDKLTLDNTPITFGTAGTIVLSQKGDDFEIRNTVGNIDLVPAAPDGSLNLYGNTNIGGSVKYEIDRYTTNSSVLIGNPRHDVVISMFSVEGSHIEGIGGTMPSLNVPPGTTIPDGTFKMIVCNNMGPGCNYTLYFNKLIAPNPRFGGAEVKEYATKLVFRRQSQSAQLVYDAIGDAWILMTSGAYVE